VVIRPRPRQTYDMRDLCRASARVDPGLSALCRQNYGR
jgi:hypothetical protein